MSVRSSKDGVVKLSDGAVLRLKITVVNAREVGFSPFGGINIHVKPIGGVATVKVPKELIDKVRDKPLAPIEPPSDGWELLDIVGQEPAIEEIVINTSKGKYVVKVEAEVVMASRNMNYKNIFNEPIYWVNWVWKVSWKPLKEG